MGIEVIQNPYVGRSYEDLKALRAELARSAQLHKIEAQRARGEVERIGQAMDGIGPLSPMVSDHAVLRWLERVEGVDVDAIRRRIAEIVRDSSTYGDDRLIEHNGLTICVTEDHVTTILTADQRPKRKAPKRRAHHGDTDE